MRSLGNRFIGWVLAKQCEAIYRLDCGGMERGGVHTKVNTCSRGAWMVKKQVW